jgi:hypothetical protein
MGLVGLHLHVLLVHLLHLMLVLRHHLLRLVGGRNLRQLRVVVVLLLRLMVKLVRVAGRDRGGGDGRRDELRGEVALVGGLL